MAYFLGAAAIVAADIAIDGVLHRRSVAAQNRDIALWNSPLSRLGRCGIYSLRATEAVEDVLTEISENEGPGWLYTNGLNFAGGRVPERIVVFAAEAVAVIDVILYEDYAFAVRYADEAALELTDRLCLPRIPVFGFVCRASLDEEPRYLPAASGRPVGVTGRPWLPGLLRARLGDNDEISSLPDHFWPAFQAGSWAYEQQSHLFWDTLREFPHWWTIINLRLDDGQDETVDVVCAGPHAVFAIDVSNVDPDGSVKRISRHIHRLRAYLPQANLVPVIITDSVRRMEFGPQVDTAGNPIAWVNPGCFTEFARKVRLRGLSPAEIAFLNAPAPGWTRSVGFGPDGPELSWGWSEE